jgi:hypothetical protein
MPILHCETLKALFQVSEMGISVQPELEDWANLIILRKKPKKEGKKGKLPKM